MRHYERRDSISPADLRVRHRLENICEAVAVFATKLFRNWFTLNKNGQYRIFGRKLGSFSEYRSFWIPHRKCFLYAGDVRFKKRGPAKPYHCFR